MTKSTKSDNYVAKLVHNLSTICPAVNGWVSNTQDFPTGDRVWGVPYPNPIVFESTLTQSVMF